MDRTQGEACREPVGGLPQSCDLTNHRLGWGTTRLVKRTEFITATRVEAATMLNVHQKSAAPMTRQAWNKYW